MRERRPDKKGQARGTAPRPRHPRTATAEPAALTAWEKQAAWYDALQGEAGDDFYSKLIIPAVLRGLSAKDGERVLDVACGQGVLGRALATIGVATTGIDASPTLIEAAKRRAGEHERYLLGDARTLGRVVRGEVFDHAALVMALQDIDDLDRVVAEVAAVLRPGGRCVVALTHPCFRIPKRTSWGFDEQWGIQYRRIDAYLSPATLPIKTHPGRPQDSASTSTFHRPLSAYLNAFGRHGLGAVGAEELCSHRRGTKGPRYQAEDRAAREIPQFLVLTAVRLAPLGN
jgi:2-polyprenyl-3-methyl-5-hydroxy-6-metoxy-1,4-benzoquinol methylase